MFGKILYFDKKAIDDYSAIISNGKRVKIEEVEVSKDVGGNIGNSSLPLSFGTKAEKKYVAKMTESLLYDCVEFEKALEDRDDFFDFTKKDSFDIMTVPRGSIIKVDALIEIPEQFDAVQMLDEFKPFFLSSFDEQLPDMSWKDAVKCIFDNSEATRMPVVAEAEDTLLCGKLCQEYVISDYSDFEELDESIILLARVSSDVIDSEKPFYDPLKDFMKLNRMMRRGMKRQDNLMPICVDKEYRKIDIIAIYS